jgi:hypothetical protein
VSSRDGILNLRELITLKNCLGRDLLGGVLDHDLVETRVFRESLFLSLHDNLETFYSLTSNQFLHEFPNLVPYYKYYLTKQVGSVDRRGYLLHILSLVKEVDVSGVKGISISTVNGTWCSSSSPSLSFSTLCPGLVPSHRRRDNTSSSEITGKPQVTTRSTHPSRGISKATPRDILDAKWAKRTAA